MKIYTTILTFIITFGAFVVSSDGQTTRRKKTGKPPTASRAQTVSSSQIIEPEIVSTADDLENEDNAGRVVINPSTGRRETKNSKPQTATATETERSPNNAALIRELDALRKEVKTLREKSGVENLEKLGLAEERAENFRRKLEDAIARENDLSSKIQQLDFQMQPEAIARETAVIGSLRPEDVRETRRKSLEAEKIRLNDQLNQARTSRARLEAAVASADALVEKLRLRVESDNETDSAATTSKDSPTKKNQNSNDEESNPQ